MSTVYTNFISGTTTDNPLTNVATTLNSANLANLPAVAAPDTMWITLDPLAVDGAPEIVQVTAHTASATSATIVRAQQSTSARQHASGTAWTTGFTKSDADELPFRKLTTTGDIIYASAANTASRLAIGAATTVLHGGTTPSYSQIVAGDIASDAVTTAKILDSNVTLAKMADNSVDTPELVDGAVETAKIADANVTAAKLEASLPLGIVGVASVTANQGSIGGTTVDLTSLTVTFTAVSGRRYRVTATVGVSTTVSGDVPWLFLVEGTSTVLQTTRRTLGSSGVVDTLHLAWVSTGSESGSLTYKLSLIRAAGSGTLTMAAASDAPAFILIEDIGS